MAYATPSQIATSAIATTMTPTPSGDHHIPSLSRNDILLQTYTAQLPIYANGARPSLEQFHIRQNGESGGLAFGLLLTDMEKDLDPEGENVPTHRELVFDIGEDPALSPEMIPAPLTNPD